jgi:hypothetical protein
MGRSSPSSVLKMPNKVSAPAVPENGSWGCVYDESHGGVIARQISRVSPFCVWGSQEL